MIKATLIKRMQELGIYNAYYYRKEVKPLAQMLHDDEMLNCIFTGVNEGNRKLVAVTDSRIIIIFAGTLGSGEIKVIKRSAVTGYGYEKTVFFANAFITTEEEFFDFTYTQRGTKELFEWAMERPVPNS